MPKVRSKLTRAEKVAAGWKRCIERNQNGVRCNILLSPDAKPVCRIHAKHVPMSKASKVQVRRMTPAEIEAAFGPEKHETPTREGRGSAKASGRKNPQFTPPSQGPATGGTP
jgi:hypothetical protein